MEYLPEGTVAVSPFECTNPDECIGLVVAEWPRATQMLTNVATFLLEDIEKVTCEADENGRITGLKQGDSSGMREVSLSCYMHKVYGSGSDEDDES